MPLHPALAKLLEEKAKRNGPHQSKLSIQEVRKNFRDLFSPALVGPLIEVEAVTNFSLPTESGSIPARLYRPAGKEPFALIVYFHGGGFVKGDLETHDFYCRRLAKTTRCLVLAVNYRLAPEHRFPQAVEDAYAAAEWGFKHAEKIGADREKVIVAGDSAGGNLAAVVAHLARDERSFPLFAQILILPVVDFTLSFPSIEMDKREILVTKEDLQWYYATYYGTDKDCKNPLVSPIWASNLKNLPPAMILTAEYDNLRDEAEAYAKKLKAAGNLVLLKRYEGMVHGFVQMSGIVKQAQESIDDIARFLQQLLVL